MKKETLKAILTYPNKKYEVVFSLFAQRALIMLYLKDILTNDKLDFALVNFEVDAYRYVFEKDISESKVMKTLLRFGFNNLVALEVIDKLKYVRKTVEEIERQEVKK